MNKVKLRTAMVVIAAFGITCLLMHHAACSAERIRSDKIKAVATTTIVGDVVRSVGGNRITLEVLLPVDADPHTLEPTPQDLAAVAEADILFTNGLGLEQFLESALGNMQSATKLVEVSDGVRVRYLSGAHRAQNDRERTRRSADPHVWLNPNNVIIWTRNIQTALSELDPDNSSCYAENARLYEEKLFKLDEWIREAIAEIPEERRKLVTDHLVFGYFAERYGFQQLGALLPGFSVLAEPSARELSELEEKIRDYDVPAIFVSTTVNPALAEQLARDTGCRLVFVYTGSLSRPEGPAASYISLIRYNVTTIVDALK